MPLARYAPFFAGFLGVCALACGPFNPSPGDPCVDSYCGPGMVCPSVDDPLLGHVNECVAPCTSAGCCGPGATCQVDSRSGRGACFDVETSELGPPSADPACWSDAACGRPGQLFGPCWSAAACGGDLACCSDGLSCLPTASGGVCAADASRSGLAECASLIGGLHCDLEADFCAPSCIAGACGVGATCDPTTGLCVHPYLP